MWLFGLFGKKKRTNAVKKSAKANNFGERMDRLTSDGELPWGWLHENQAFISKIENEYKHFTDAYYNSRKKGLKQEYAALKSLILYREDVKELCNRKGECFALWSTFMVADPKDIVIDKERLKKLEAKIKTEKK